MTVLHGIENPNHRGGILVVARDWGEVEEDLGRPLVGPAGHLFDEVFPLSGLRRQDITITNVVPETRPPDDDFRRHDPRDVEAGRRALDRLVKRMKPKLIITMGNEAAYHFVPDWPTGGRDIFGAKGIEDRRGYFWETPSGLVLTLLHPAGALRRIVPGYELLRRDFQRVQRWRQGKLPREEFPDVRSLKTEAQAKAFLRQSVVSFDIETRWGHVYCCGFCGDDDQPVVARYGPGFRAMRTLLRGRKGMRGVAHNGPFDVDLLDRDDFPTALYTDDTQAAWGNALEPELAFRDEESQGRLTRKGLASLASLCPDMNVPYWKADYTRYGFDAWEAGYSDPDTEDPAELAKLYVMAGRDAYVTRRLWDWLWTEVQRQQVEPQYRLAFETNLRCITMTRRGWRVDEKLRKRRIKTLTKRSEEAKAQAREAGLAYIEAHHIETFKQTKQCPCCGNGDKKRDACWSCAGFDRAPTKAMLQERIKDGNGGLSKEQLEALVLDFCETCMAAGTISWYDFNPYSRHQLVKLLYDYVGAPQWVFKKKVKMDEMAHLRMLQWAEGGKQ